MRYKVLSALVLAGFAGACTTTDPAGGASAAFVAAPKAKAPVSRELIEEELLRSVALSL